MENFYTESKEYLDLQQRLKDLGHIDLSIDLAKIVNDAIMYGISQFGKKLMKERKYDHRHSRNNDLGKRRKKPI